VVLGLVAVAGCEGLVRVVGLVRVGVIDPGARSEGLVVRLRGRLVQAMLARCWWSLSRFPARLMNAHSERAAGRPRRRKRRVLRLCLRSPKTGSISWERCA
jgi:hypothetical protein